MKFEAHVIVLSAKKYAFTDEATKEHKDGCTLRYCFDLNPVERQNFRGIDLMKANFPPEAFDKLPEAPCYVSMEFEQQANSKGQIISQPIGFTWVEAFAVSNGKK